MTNPFHIAGMVKFGAARFGAPSPSSAVWAAYSDATIYKARSTGQWVTMQNMGYMDPNDPNAYRHDDGTWGPRNNPSINVGYAIGLHDVVHHGIAGAWQDVESAISGALGAVGSALSAVESVVNSVVTDAESVVTTLGSDVVSVVGNIISSFPNDVDALIGLAKFILQIAGDLLAVVDPTGTTASRSAALQRLNPFKVGSTVYNFITLQSYDASFRMLFWIIILGPLILAVFPLLLAQANPLTQQSIEAIISAFRAVVTGVASGRNVFATVEAVVADVISALLGVPVGPATSLKITYLVLAGLPIPPILAILDVVLADPIAQQFIGRTLNLPNSFVDKWMPIAASCLNVADGGSWLTCLEGVIDGLFPALVSTLQKFSIDLNDLRTIVQSAWETGGDINLMLRHNVVANKVQFSGDLSSLSPVTVSFISIGFFGIGFLASKIGIQNADGFFINTFCPLLPSDVRAEVQSSYDVFRFLEQLVIEGGKSEEQLQPSHIEDNLPSDVLYLIESFHSNKWDVESTMTSIIADELDPSTASFRFFSSLLPVDPHTGKFEVSATFIALTTKLLTDYPKLTYQIKALLDHLEIDPSQAVSSSSHVAAVASAISNKIPSTPQGVVQIPAGLIGGSTSSAASSNLNLEAVGAGALTGAFIGGPVGALVGAATGLLAKK